MILFSDYIKLLVRFGGYRVPVLMGMTLLLGLTQGVGLVMILPFLHLIGINASASTAGQIETYASILKYPGFGFTLFSLLCIYLAVIIAHAFAARYRSILAASIVNGFNQYLRNRLYTRFCHADWLCFLETRNADITHVLVSDIQKVSQGTQMFFQWFVSWIIVIIHLIYSFSVSTPMTFCALIIGVFLLFVLRPFNRRAVRYGASLREDRKNLHRVVTDHIDVMKISRSMGLEAFYQDIFFTITEQISNRLVGFEKVTSHTRMIYQVFAVAAIAVFIGIGVEMLQVPAVNLIIIVFLFSRIIPGLSNLQQGFQRILNTMPAFRAVVDLDNKLKKGEAKEFQAKTADASPDSSPIVLKREIRFDSVYFRYNKTRPNWVLKHLDFTIPAHAVTAVSGPSGAGKSSVADLVLGLLAPDKGEIWVDGTRLRPDILLGWRKTIGYVPQDVFLFHESLRDNLLRALPDATDAQLWEALERASAKSFVSGLSQGLDTIVKDRGIRFSGGERQSIALARALLRRPSLLILDEATSSLDDKNEQRIQEALERLKQELTIIVIAHRDSAIRISDYVIRLENGTVMPKV